MSANPPAPGDGSAGNTNAGTNAGAGAGAPASSMTSNARFTPQQQHAPAQGVATTTNQSTTSPSTTTPNNQNLNQIVGSSFP